MERLGPASHPQAPGQGALSLHARADAGGHGVAQEVQVGLYLGAGAGGDLVGHDHVRDPQPLAGADLQQGGGGGEGVGGGRGVGLGAGGGGQGADRRRPRPAGVLHDKAPAHRVVGAAQDLVPGRAVGGQGHAVDVVGQDPAGQEVDVGGRGEGDGADAVDREAPGGLDLGHEPLAHGGRDGLGDVASQAHDGGAVGGVAAAGGAERPVELNDDAGHRGVVALVTAACDPG